MNVLDRPPADKDIEAILGVGSKKTKRPVLLWVLVALAAVGAGWYLFLRDTTPQTIYTTEPAARGNMTVTVTATGTVQPTNEVDVSSELSGIIRTVHVDNNDAVTAGQVIAELDTVKLAAQVERSRAALAASKARLAQAEATLVERRRNLERTQSLNAKQFSSENALDIAKADFDRAEAALESAKADVRVAEAELKENETNLSKSKIYSPVNGVVLRRSAEPGQTVAASFQAPILFTLAEDLRRMELQVDVDEADIGQVRAGQRATFTVEAYQGRSFPAEIESVRYASETVNGVVTYKAILTAENADLSLRPGMTATAEIVVEDVNDALLIPNAALRWKPPEPEKARRGGGGFTLFRFPQRPREVRITEPESNTRRIYLLKEGRPVAADVTVGSSDGRRTVVTGGLEAGAAVITNSEGPGP